MSLFISAQHGETKLNIPGFPTIMARGHYNVYTRVIDSIILYSEDGGCEFAKWNPGSEVPAYFSDESSDYQIIVRTKCKNSDEYVYAYIEHVRSLAEATGEMKESLIGWNFKYTSPIDPITFKGF